MEEGLVLEENLKLYLIWLKLKGKKMEICIFQLID